MRTEYQPTVRVFRISLGVVVIELQADQERLFAKAFRLVGYLLVAPRPVDLGCRVRYTPDLDGAASLTT